VWVVDIFTFFKHHLFWEGMAEVMIGVIYEVKKMKGKEIENENKNKNKQISLSAFRFFWINFLLFLCFLTHSFSV